MSGTTSATTLATIPGASITQFTPFQNGVFQFPATINGAQATLQIFWNYAGQRWYLNFFQGNDTGGTPVLSTALAGSGDGNNVNLALQLGGNSIVVFRTSTNNIEISP